MTHWPGDSWALNSAGISTKAPVLFTKGNQQHLRSLSQDQHRATSHLMRLMELRVGLVRFSWDYISGGQKENVDHRAPFLGKRKPQQSPQRSLDFPFPPFLTHLSFCHTKWRVQLFLLLLFSNFWTLLPYNVQKMNKKNSKLQFCFPSYTMSHNEFLLLKTLDI